MDHLLTSAVENAPDFPLRRLRALPLDVDVPGAMPEVQRSRRHVKEVDAPVAQQLLSTIAQVGSDHDGYFSRPDQILCTRGEPLHQLLGIAGIDGVRRLDSKRGVLLLVSKARTYEEVELESPPFRVKGHFHLAGGNLQPDDLVEGVKKQTAAGVGYICHGWHISCTANLRQWPNLCL